MNIKRMQNFFFLILQGPSPFILSSWAGKDSKPGNLGTCVPNRQVARRFTRCRHRSCERIERKAPLGKREQRMEEREWGKEQLEGETYRRLLIQFIPTMSKKTDTRHVSTARMIKLTEVWVSPAWGNTGCESAQDLSLQQVPWSSTCEEASCCLLPPPT